MRPLGPALPLALVLAVALASGCSCSDGESDPDGATPGDDAGGAPIDADRMAFCRDDADGDGIPDSIEGMADPDGDGVPSHVDPDADGDGIPDRDERRSTGCYPADTDGDGIPDFLDLDADDDGVSDADERVAGTDPSLRDTDGDGCWDSFDALCDESPVIVRLIGGETTSAPLQMTLAATASEVRIRIVDRGGFAPFPAELVLSTWAAAVTPTEDGRGHVDPAPGPLQFELELRDAHLERVAHFHVATIELVADGTVVGRRPLLVLVEEHILLI